MAGTNKKRQRRVQAESDLRFGPQEDNLALALQDAASTRNTTIRSARGTAAAQVRAAQEATPALAKALRDPTSTVAGTETNLAHILQGLPGDGGALAGASARDAEGTKRRLAELLAGVASENISRARDAKAGQAFAVSNARNQFGAARDRIRAQLGSLGRQEGEFAQTQYDDLTSAAADRKIRLDTQKETGRHNTVTEGVAQQNADTAAAKAKAKAKADKIKADAKKVASPVRVDSMQAALNGAIGDATRMEKANRPRSYAKQTLASGRTSQTLKNDENGQPLPNPVKIPGVSKVKSQAIAAAALDMAYVGYVSQHTVGMLRELGVTPQQLNLPTAPKTGAPLQGPRPLPSGVGALRPGTPRLGILPSAPTR
jgi:hypothetical protein